METKIIVMCAVALLLGILISDMLQNVCGCKDIVEGQICESTSCDGPIGPDQIVGPHGPCKIDPLQIPPQGGVGNLRGRCVDNEKINCLCTVYPNTGYCRSPNQEGEYGVAWEDPCREFSGPDKDACVDQVVSDGNNCVWAAIDGVGETALPTPHLSPSPRVTGGAGPLPNIVLSAPLDAPRIQQAEGVCTARACKDEKCDETVACQCIVPADVPVEKEQAAAAEGGAPGELLLGYRWGTCEGTDTMCECPPAEPCSEDQARHSQRCCDLYDTDRQQFESEGVESEMNGLGLQGCLDLNDNPVIINESWGTDCKSVLFGVQQQVCWEKDDTCTCIVKESDCHAHNLRDRGPGTKCLWKHESASSDQGCMSEETANDPGWAFLFLTGNGDSPEVPGPIQPTPPVLPLQALPRVITECSGKLPVILNDGNASVVTPLTTGATAACAMPDRARLTFDSDDHPQIDLNLPI